VTSYRLKCLNSTIYIFNIQRTSTCFCWGDDDCGCEQLAVTFSINIRKQNGIQVTALS